MEITAAGGLRGKTALMHSRPPAGAAAVTANNPLASVVLVYAQTSYERLDTELAPLEVYL